MKRRIWIQSLLAIVVLGIPGVAAAEPKDVGKLSNALSNSSWTSCLAEIDAALKGGDTLETVANLWYSEVPGATKFKSSQGNELWSAPLSAVQSHCNEQVAKMKTRLALGEIQDVLASARDLYKTYFAGGGDVSWDAVDTLSRVAKKCPALIDAALANGIKASEPLKLRTGETTTLGEASAKYCAPLVTAVTKLVAKNLADAEAAIAPYKNLLKEGKLTLVLARGTTGWYGKGCKQMATAAQLDKAKVWYEISVDQTGIRPRWNARAYTFKGNQLAGTKDRSGWGNDAPASACK